METKKYICKACRTEVDDSQQYCGNCGAHLKSIDDKMAQVAIAFAKDTVNKVKERIKKIDPGAKLKVFTPVSKAQKGFIVKTNAPEELKKLIKELHARVVSGGKLGAGNSPAFASED